MGIFVKMWIGLIKTVEHGIAKEDEELLGYESSPSDITISFSIIRSTYWSEKMQIRFILMIHVNFDWKQRFFNDSKILK